MRSQNPFDHTDTTQTVELSDRNYGVEQKGGKLKNEDEENKSYLGLCSCFPLGYFCFGGGLILILCTALDTLLNKDTLIQFFLRVYLLFFGGVIMIIEPPSWRFSRRFQLKIFFWYRILSRMWGRGWFYLFLSMLCFSEFDRKNSAEFTIVAGFYLMMLSVLCFVFSKSAANKLQRIFVFIGHGSEGEELKARIERKYDELVFGANREYVVAHDIIKLANDADRDLSNADVYAIQTFLDFSCNGCVVKTDWIKQFTKMTTQKQRFL
eukprot:235903_1